MHRHLVLALLIAFAAGPQSAPAQGKLLEQLMRDLLESQRERQQQPAPQRETRRSPATRTIASRGPTRPPVRTEAVRGELQQFSNGADQLFKQLRDEVRRNPSVAPFLVQVMRAKSRADMLDRSFEQGRPEAEVLVELLEFDREWRDTAHRLGAVRGLSEGCRKSCDRLTQLCSACCGHFELKPQIDHREASRLADALVAELRHLERDIRYDVRPHNKARRLVVEVQRVQALAELIGEAAYQGADTDVLADEFRQYARQWRPIARELNALGSPHLDRTLAEIRNANRGLRTCLRLQERLDLERVRALAHTTQELLLGYCDRLTLGALLRQPNAAEIVVAAQRLQREAEALCQCAGGQASEADLVEHCVSLDNAWRDFDALSTPLVTRSHRAAREGVLVRLDELRGTLGVRVAVDRDRIAHVAAQLASVANEAERRVGVWSQRPGARIDAATIRSAKRLIDECQALHEQCVRQTPVDKLARDCHHLAEHWAELRPQLMRCDTVDQRVLRRLADDASARLIELQGLLDAAAGWPTS